MSTTTQDRPDRITNLVEYLTALAKINTTPPRTIDIYRKVFWLHSLPIDHKYCFSRTWEQAERGGDQWIEVKKCVEPAQPDPPEKCAQWINQDAPRQTDSPPQLHHSIARPKKKRPQKKKPGMGKNFI
ncbi:MAG: hypothetical protein D3924_01960 [Candidatus Electrothrix sp. AR4]|nr:hypothetical protein [Candidatus Electrothrix sp. AR4]